MFDQNNTTDPVKNEPTLAPDQAATSEPAKKVNMCSLEEAQAVFKKKKGTSRWKFRNRS